MQVTSQNVQPQTPENYSGSLNESPQVEVARMSDSSYNERQTSSIEQIYAVVGYDHLNKTSQQEKIDKPNQGHEAQLNITFGDTVSQRIQNTPNHLTRDIEQASKVALLTKNAGSIITFLRKGEIATDMRRRDGH